MATQESHKSSIPRIPGHKRRALTNGQLACQPCRLRKVRCSFETPCKVCRDRGHAHLCVYGQPRKRINIEPSTSQHAESSVSSDSRVEAQRDLARIIAKVDRLAESLHVVANALAHQPASDTPQHETLHSRELQKSSPEQPEPSSSRGVLDGDNVYGETLSFGWQPPATEIHVTNPVTGESVYLGSNSVPAMVLALGKANPSAAVQGLLEKSTLPIFTLDNEDLTYPFVDLWGLPHGSVARIEKLCALLPSSSDCLSYVRQYRDVAHVLFPAIVNMPQFEAEVGRFLMARSAVVPESTHDQFTERDVYGMTLHWVGLLFAALALGCQCSTMARRERQLTSQVYVCCAYECLRIVNYLSCADQHDIQTLLIIGNVLSNNMNPGIAWALLGLTIRLAQALGLHLSAPFPTAIEAFSPSQRIWSCIIWQDSFLSLSYDRATSTTTMTQWANTPPSPTPLQFPYERCMLRLCLVTLEVVDNRTAAPIDGLGMVRRICEGRERVLVISRQAAPHLKDLSACIAMTDYMEYWNWNMHRSFVLSELSQPILTYKADTQPVRADAAKLKALCIDALSDTVDAFLNLCNLTSFARSSWAAVHRSLSSALLLGILRQPQRDDKVRHNLERLISVMSSGEDFGNPNSAEMPAPVTRAVNALRKLAVVDESSESNGVPSSSETWGPNGAVAEAAPHMLVRDIMWGSQASSL